MFSLLSVLPTTSSRIPSAHAIAKCLTLVAPAHILAPRISPETTGATIIPAKFTHHNNLDSYHNRSPNYQVNEAFIILLEYFTFSKSQAFSNWAFIRTVAST